MSADPRLRALIRGFAVEASDLCEGITRDVLELERGTRKGPELAPYYENVARALHTLKGGAGTLGLDELSEMAHKMEDGVVARSKALEAFPSGEADALLESLDKFMLLLRAFASGDDGSTQDLGDQPAAAAEPAILEAGQEWRVSADRVVSLMKEVERLRVVRLRLDERRREVVEVLAAVADLSKSVDAGRVRALLVSVAQSIAADGQEAAEIVDELENGVKAICTQPFRTIVEPLHRAVRDLCRSAGKEAKLSLVGGEISLDRRVLDALKGPLVHLVRNAVDHGIEEPGTRVSRGKHREGTIVIRVEQQGNVVFIEVADDGNGLDPERIREVAAERQVMPADELARLDAQKLTQLIFLPNFSTSRQLTETSGRGIGMDVVRSRVEELRGHVEVQSVPKQGTRFLLTLRVELGSSPILVVRCDEHEFGLPMLAVESIVPARQSNVQAGRTHTKLRHGEQLFQLRDLGALMQLRQPRLPYGGQPILLVHSQGERIALVVDEVVGDRDLVIRPLPREVSDVPAYQGASSLARGELITILRPDWLVGARQQIDSLPSSKRALVVDDSLTARALHRAMLEAGGYSVHALSSATQALEQLEHSAYDVIVCDVAMHPMDGYEFARRVRARAETRSTPIIIVSAREEDAHRVEALASGADAFLSKQDCAAGRLLTELADVIARKKGAA